MSFVLLVVDYGQVIKRSRRFGAAKPGYRDFWPGTGVLAWNRRFGPERRPVRGRAGGAERRAERRAKQTVEGQNAGAGTKITVTRRSGDKPTGSRVTGVLAWYRRFGLTEIRDLARDQ